MNTFFVRVGVALMTLVSSIPAFAGEIHEAAGQGDLGKVRALLKENPALASSKDDVGATPLHYAASYRKDIAELLLATRAKVNAKANGGMPPLHIAAREGQKDVAELLAAKAEVNASDNDGYTPLHFAAHNAEKDIVNCSPPRPT
jgi:ankyrin repeat protein